MNTKLIMLTSSLLLGATGLLLTFASNFAMQCLKVETNSMTVVIGQIMGALYFGFAMLNWMTKESLIGGIYNRPVAIANFTHFAIAALALIKLWLANREAPTALWIMGGIYITFAIAFILLLFRHPDKAG